mgnify:CR=1 FL=1
MSLAVLHLGNPRKAGGCLIEYWPVWQGVEAYHSWVSTRFHDHFPRLFLNLRFLSVILITATPPSNSNDIPHPGHHQHVGSPARLAIPLCILLHVCLKGFKYHFSSFFTYVQGAWNTTFQCMCNGGWEYQFSYIFMLAKGQKSIRLQTAVNTRLAGPRLRACCSR